TIASDMQVPPVHFCFAPSYSRAAGLSSCPFSFCVGSGTDIPSTSTDVRFTPERGHRLSALRCPLRAKRRHCNNWRSLPILGTALHRLERLHSRTCQQSANSICKRTLRNWLLN